MFLIGWLQFFHLNEAIMAEFREEMGTHYFDPSKYDTYLEQLGIEYPTVRREGP